ncbi:unnamed protein product [Orchesella dallaii]|uniref:DNA mitochondrial polymerase exonuclease domain-containing protein n=1 Tax=Orchesella dallaii TaxID=48710 RepID=A0ABP1RTS8_9HEXA
MFRQRAIFRVPQCRSTLIHSPFAVNRHLFTGIPQQEVEAPRSKYDRSESKKADDIVWNPCNIQMIPDKLYEQVFIDTFRQKLYPPEIIDKCKEHLEAHSLWDQSVKPVIPINLKIPTLEGEDINDHFRNVALQQTFVYKKLMDAIANSKIPPQPKEWKFTGGWTKYLPNGLTEKVQFPEEDAMIFDVEVCVNAGNAPTLACALTPNGWYSWCSDTLVIEETAVDEQEAKLGLKDLVPLETHRGEYSIPRDRLKEKIVIGHNVSYDRARIKEQYFLKGTKTRFMDTMSLHIAVSGITSYQRALKLTAKSGINSLGPSQMKKLGLESTILEWNDQSSLNNLADVYKLYCDEELTKSSRDIFVKGTLDDIRDQFQSLVSYCANDVEATKRVFSHLLPLYHERFPHPVTLAGMLEMGTTYLPINSRWLDYISQSEGVFNACEMEIKAILMQKAEEALELLKDERYKDDPWLWNLDWKIPKKRKSKTQSTLDETPSFPAWYRKLLYKENDSDYLPGPAKISTSMQLVPKILRLTWFGFPLHYSRKGGWGFLVSSSEENLLPASKEEIDGLSSAEDGTDETPDQSAFPYTKWMELWTKAKERLLKTHSANKETGKQSVTDLANSELRNKSEQSAEEILDFIRGLETLSSSGLWSKGKRKKKADIVSIECSPHPKCLFVPLPHKDGPNNRVGNPLAKDFLAKIEEGILASADDNDFANKVVRISLIV